MGNYAYKGQLGYVISDQEGLEKFDEDLVPVDYDEAMRLTEEEHQKAHADDDEMRERLLKKGEDMAKAREALAIKLGVTQEEFKAAFG